MPQSSAIFAFLAVAFLVFITQKGELRIYWGLLTGNTGTATVAPSAPAQAQATQNGTSLNTAISYIEAAAPEFAAAGL